MNNTIYPVSFGAKFRPLVKANRARWNQIGDIFEKNTGKTSPNETLYMGRLNGYYGFDTKKSVVLNGDAGLYIEDEKINKLFTEANDKTVAQKLVKLYREVKIFQNVQNKSQKLMEKAQKDTSPNAEIPLQKAEAKVKRYVENRFKRFANDKFLAGIS